MGLHRGWEAFSAAPADRGPARAEEFGKKRRTGDFSRADSWGPADYSLYREGDSGSSGDPHRRPFLAHNPPLTAHTASADGTGQDWFARDGGVGQRITNLVGTLETLKIPVISATGNSFRGAQGEGFTAIIPDTISVTATDSWINLCPMLSDWRGDRRRCGDGYRRTRQGDRRPTNGSGFSSGDICHATGRPMDLKPDHDGRLVADIVAEWAELHRLSLDLVLDGQASGTFRHGRDGERVEIDAIDFIRTLAGRRPGSRVLSNPLPL